MTDVLTRRNVDFLLFDVLKIDGLCQADPYLDQDADLYRTVLDQASRLAQDMFEPFAAKLDAQEPEFIGGQVRIIPELGAAIEAYVDAGFPALGFPQDVGGMGLPFTVSTLSSLYFTAANGPAQGYAFLTAAAANLLLHFGSADQIDRYARPMIQGRWFGTMALSEPQAGSSLAEIRTRAEPTNDGHYRLTGSKMWISGAEHDLRENIVNLVLARLPDAPAGVKGISLFIVPKFVVDEHGALGRRNGIDLVGLNRKMGNRGTTNTVLSFGQPTVCEGELVGKPHLGLSYMFHMMNEARIGVGASAATTALTGYRHAVDYARDRRQGRRLGGTDPQPVPIIEHPDVARMLMQQKVIAEGGLHLCLYCARLIDEQMASTDPEEREDLGLLLEVLTPIAKAWPSERGCEANALAIQVHGGYGYTHDFPVERLYRDQRLNPIHEGTTGIQALDLLGRKVGLSGGRGLGLVRERVLATVEDAWTIDALKTHGLDLRRACEVFERITEQLRDRIATDPADGLAEATLYLEAAGQLVVGWLWLAQAIAASHHRSDDAFARSKLAACQFYFRHELPRVESAARVFAQPGRPLLTPDMFEV